MNEAEVKAIKEGADALLEIFNRNEPIKSDGSFSPELVKITINEMISHEFSESEAQSLRDWMDKNEFWTSPASARYHGNKKGGLAAHSLLVARQALTYSMVMAENFLTSKIADKFTFTAKDILISAIAHDFCKAGSYQTDTKRVKDFNGNWTYETFYKVKGEQRNLGHGNESVLILLEILPEYIRNRTVIEAVSRHMGFSDLSPMESYNYSNFLQNPLVVLLQLADESGAQWWNI